MITCQRFTYAPSENRSGCRCHYEAKVHVVCLDCCAMTDVTDFGESETPGDPVPHVVKQWVERHRLHSGVQIVLVQP